MQCNTQQVNFRPVLFPVSALSIRTLAQLGKFLTDGLRLDWGPSSGLMLMRLSFACRSRSGGSYAAVQVHRVVSFACGRFRREHVVGSNRRSNALRQWQCESERATRWRFN